MKSYDNHVVMTPDPGQLVEFPVTTIRELLLELLVLDGVENIPVNDEALLTEPVYVKSTILSTKELLSKGEQSITAQFLSDFVAIQNWSTSIVLRADSATKLVEVLRDNQRRVVTTLDSFTKNTVRVQTRLLDPLVYRACILFTKSQVVTLWMGCQRGSLFV